MPKVNEKDLQEVKDNVSKLLSFGEMPNVRLPDGPSNRQKQIMTWRLPNNSTIQMYINPESLVVSESKQINYVRTKGGFVVQYWGDNLTRLTLSGTTGSSGVKGINVLRDIYHAENRAFDLVAETQANQAASFTARAKDATVDDFYTLSYFTAERGFILRPSLASLAVSVILYYQGINYKGFFTEFNVTESVSKNGLFEYNLTFMATEIRGRRENFMAWHKEPLADDLAGQLTGSMLGGIGNAARSLFGLQASPVTFHPEDAPLTFGGNSVSAQMGVQST